MRLHVSWFLKSGVGLVKILENREPKFLSIPDTLTVHTAVADVNRMKKRKMRRIKTN